MKNGKPVIGFGGYGRSGKDEAAMFFGKNTTLKFEGGGCSYVARHYMAKRLSEDYGRLVTPDEAYETRHSGGDELRNKWFNYLNEFRIEDPVGIIKLCLVNSDMVCGPRDLCEITESKRQGIVDLWIWVKRWVPIDPTVRFSPYDCDIVIENEWSLEVYHDRLKRLAKSLGVWNGGS